MKGPLSYDYTAISIVYILDHYTYQSVIALRRSGYIFLHSPFNCRKGDAVLISTERLDLLSAFPAEFLDEGPGVDDLDTVEVLDLQEMMVS